MCGKSHGKAEETVFDERVFGNASLFQEDTQFSFREEMHVVAGSPAFAKESSDAVKEGLRKQDMEKRDTSVDFDREKAVGCGAVAMFSYAVHFFEKGELLFSVSHMFDHGVGVRNVKTVVREGKVGAIGCLGFDFGIPSSEFVPICFETDGGDIGRITIEPFKEVIVLGVFDSVDPDIKNSSCGRCLGPFQKLEPLSGSAFA